MIHSLKIKNFLSFKEETTFSFVATDDTFAEASQVVDMGDSVKLSRLAIIYGYNASGKSNLLRAFGFIRDFWKDTPVDKMQGTDAVPFRFDIDTPNQDSEFELIFYTSKDERGSRKKYRYKLHINRNFVTLEELYLIQQNGVQIFTRTTQNGLSQIKFNDKQLKLTETVKEKISLECLPNTSVFAATKKVNIEVPDIGEAIKSFLELSLPLVDTKVDLTKFGERNCDEDERLKQAVVSLMKEADFNIQSLEIKKKDVVIPDFFRDMLIHDDDTPSEIKEKLQDGASLSRKVTKSTAIHSVYSSKGEEENYELAFTSECQSNGTLKVFGLATVIYKTLFRGAFLPIDEMETALHPKLFEALLFEFLKVEGSESQLLITTHNDGLLDLVDDLIRKDSVCFAEKRNDGSTELYKLIDFKGIEFLKSIRSAYRAKRFGATMHSL